MIGNLVIVRGGWWDTLHNTGYRAIVDRSNSGDWRRDLMMLCIHLLYILYICT